MFTLTRIFLCLAVSLTLAGASAAQTRSKPKSGSRKAKQKPKEMTIIGPAVEEPEVRQVGAARLSYSAPPSDSRLVMVYLSEVYRERGQAIDLSVNFRVAGREGGRPDEVRVNVHSDGNSFRPKRLVLEADGRQFSFNITSGGAGSGLVPYADIDFPSFEQIANSKSVKGSVGRLTFELDESHREALRDMLRALEVPAKSP